MSSDLEAHLRRQAAACGDIGSPMYEALLSFAADDYAAGGPVAELLRDWTLDPGPAALALRIAGTVHRFALAGEAPDLARFPTGGEVVERYLQPLAATPQLQPHLRLGARVTMVTKQRRDRMKDAQRNDVPFLVRYEDAAGEHEGHGAVFHFFVLAHVRHQRCGGDGAARTVARRTRGQADGIEVRANAPGVGLRTVS